MRRIAILLAAVIMIISCASVPRRLLEDDFRFELQVTNEEFQDVTLFLLNGGVRQRLRNCAPIVPCKYFFNDRRTEDIFEAGYVDLAWRWASAPGGFLAGHLILDVTHEMVFLMNIQDAGAWLRPGYYDNGRSVDE